MSLFIPSLNEIQGLLQDVGCLSLYTMKDAMANETKISFVLSFISGFVDTAGFIALFGLFTAHITGNLVLAGTVFFDPGTHANLAGKLLMVPVFVLSVMFAGYLIKYKKATARNLVLTEAVFIACFALIGAYVLNNRPVPDNNSVTAVASFAVMGMAVQNTYMRKLLGSYTPNTVMTGNITEFSMDLFDAIDDYLSRKKDRGTDKKKIMSNSFKKVNTVLTGFLGGCILGAFLVKGVGLICCLLPSLLLSWVYTQMGDKQMDLNRSQANGLMPGEQKENTSL